MSDRTKENYEEYYEVIEVIGIGGYGCVYKGREKKTKELRAIKVISLEQIKDNLISEYLSNEIEEPLKLCINGFIEVFNIMKICSNNNNNSVKCFEYFNNKDNFVIIMELCDQNLSQLLYQRLRNENKGFNIEEIYEIMNQLNNTFKIMRENNIIHRDLSLENILIKYNDKEHKKYTIKLSGYGCSKRLKSLSMNCNLYCDTLVYMAPEILKSEKYNYKCDLWSIGIIIYRLIFGKSPYSGETGIALLNSINRIGNKIIKIENEVLEDLIKKLLEKEPSERIDWDKYFNHLFFKPKDKHIIKLIYYADKINEVRKYGTYGAIIDGKDGIFNIFGEKFVENNKNKIEIKINGLKEELVKEYKLNKGENEIEIIIKNKIINLEYMFYNCTRLINIEDLKYLDTKEANNLSYMFYNCSSLSHIKPLENWNVSNANNFSYMFYNCSSLSHIKPLENWNVSNANNFSYMFSYCSSLSDIKPLENWNVSNANNFSYMFSHCSSLSEIKALENWNVSNGNNFSEMFSHCSSLSHIKPLENWNVSNANNFSYMFSYCSSLSDIKPLEKWNVSNGTDFSYMFYNCKSLSDINPLENWNVSNGNIFEKMFSGCKSLSELKIVKIQKLMNDLKIFFSCIYCKNIVSHPYSCSCQKFICEKCFLNNEKEELCSFCHKKFVKENNSDIDYLVSEIFKDQKVIKEKINFYILLLNDLKNLYLNKNLKLIVKYNSLLSLQEEKNLINIISNENVFENLKDFDKSFIPINILDYISTVGDLIDNYIKKNKNSFIDINKALSNKKGSSLYISGILARLLMNEGINVAIEKETTFPKLSKNLLDWLMIGLLKFKKIILKLDYGEKRNKKILENEEEKKKIIEYWIQYISTVTKINRENLFFVSIKKGCLQLTLATQENLDNSNLVSSDKEIIDIRYSMLLNGCLISEKMFDTKWNNEGSGWARKGEKRGGALYDPPKDYYGYGLTVSKLYDNGNDTWLGMNNIKGEWWVAYHGVGRRTNDQQIKIIIKNIVENGFKIGPNQYHDSADNINPESNAEFQKVGTGVYLTDKIGIAEDYAGRVKDNDENEFKVVFMCRVCPNKTRISDNNHNYFVLDPNKDCIRPYRILLKPLNSNNNNNCHIL